MNGRAVDRELHGIRLQDFLEREWAVVDRAVLRRAVAAEQVAVNGMPAGARTRLRAGDHVELRLQDRELQAFRAPSQSQSPTPAVRVLFENDAVVVVDKPAGEPTIPDRAGKYPGVYGRFCAERPDADLRVVHRLDRQTSGCLLFAKGLDAARALDLAFRARQVGKQYLALVEGIMRSERLEIDKPLGPDPRRPGKVTVVKPNSRGARAAQTVVEVEERFRMHTLLRVRPLTGRSHQIRVHLSHRGYPIVADHDYGGRRALLLSEIKPGYKRRTGTVERPLLERMFLHAERIEWTPAAGAPVAAVAPLPDDLVLVLDKLRRFAAPRRGECD